MRVLVRQRRVFITGQWWAEARCPCCPEFYAANRNYGVVMAKADQHSNDPKFHRGH